MKVLMAIAAALGGLAALAWLGLRMKPRPLPSLGQPSSTPATVPLAEGLPAPVARFYGELYGADLPVVDSFVVSGRATLRVMRIHFPSRFRFTHVAGRAYRHYIETTIFGLPIMKVNEHYVDGTSRLELPFGVEEGPGVDQSANLGLWAESLWVPSVLVTQPNVRWEAMDAETAVLVVPFGQEEQRFVVCFDPRTRLVRFLESMRYKGSNSDSKTLWINEVLTWGKVDGNPVPVTSAATWYDEGTPWAVFTVEEIQINVTVGESIRARGP